jgi:hypothetical protein
MRIKTGYFLILFFCFSYFLKGQTNVSGVIATNTSWSVNNSPYIVTGNILINSGITLTIDPGVTIKFNDNIGIVVQGQLTAIGSANNKIIFTSNKANPQPGDWASLKFNPTATSSNWNVNNNYLSGSGFAYCDFLYAGNSAINTEVGLYISNCRFINNKNWGEYRNGVFQSGSQFYYAGGAITTKGGSSLIQKSLFFKNSSNNGYSHGFGGAIYVSSGTSKITKCVFISNLSEGFGEGGAIQSTGTSIISNCNFVENSGTYNGSAIGIGGSSNISNSTFSSNSNSTYGLISNYSSGSFVINYCNFYGAENYIIYNRNGNAIDAKYNFWASNILNNINSKLFDFFDLFSLGIIDYSLYLSQANLNSPISQPINVIKSSVTGGVKLTWTPNTELNIAGYKVYYSGFTGYSYQNVTDVHNVNTYTLLGASINDSIALTAYNINAVGIDDQVNGTESWYTSAKNLGNLPTIITNFKVYQKNTGIQLEWNTQSEINLDSYEVEKSMDGSNFTKAGTVIAKGLSAYNWFDASPTNGSNYYRLKMIDKDGSFKYSSIVNVKIGGIKNVFTVAGNPIKNKIVELQMRNVEKGNYTISVYNNIGQQIMSKIIVHGGGSASQTLYLNKVYKGTYQLSITGSNIRVTKTLLVE